MSECLFKNTLPLFVASGGMSLGGGYGGGGPIASMGSQFGGAAGGIMDGGDYFASAPFPMMNSAMRRSDAFVVEVFLTDPSQRMGRRDVEIRLRNNSDPLFLLQCAVSEEEYFVMRRDQKLLVDYSQFPFKLVELLQQCALHGNEDRPLFSAILRASPSMGNMMMTGNVLDGACGDGRCAELIISEATSFRQIVHLQLRLRSPNEAALRRHLAQVVRQYQEEIASLRSGQTDYFAPSTSSVPFSSAPFTAGGSAEAADLRKKIVQLQSELDQLRRTGQTTAAAPINTEVCHDINKANDIIRRLQMELQNQRVRAENVASSMPSSSSAPRAFAAGVDDITDDSLLRSELRKTKTQLAEVTAERDRLRLEVDETRQLVSANEKVIEWLHERMAADPSVSGGLFSPKASRSADHLPVKDGGAVWPLSANAQRNSEESTGARKSASGVAPEPYRGPYQFDSTQNAGGGIGQDEDYDPFAYERDVVNRASNFGAVSSSSSSPENVALNMI